MHVLGWLPTLNEKWIPGWVKCLGKVIRSISSESFLSKIRRNLENQE
jgi:hypothetical protein